jgi:hypothetical protein
MATTTNYSWETPDDTDLVKDGAAAIRTLGSSIDTTTKALNPSTTLGDIEYRSSTANTNTRLGIGTTGQVLTVSGGVPAWVAPAGGGKILQVVTAQTTTTTTISSTTYTDTTLTATITPTSASSTILVLISQAVEYSIPASLVSIGTRIVRGATTIFDGGLSADRLKITGATVVEHGLRLDMKYIDSPATTSATTYKTQGRMSATGSGETSTYQAVSPWGGTAAPSTIILMEIGA